MGFFSKITAYVGKLITKSKYKRGKDVFSTPGSIQLAIPQAVLDRAEMMIYQKYAPIVEDILRKHIKREIENKTAGSGGPWYPDGSPYVKRNVLAGSVTHYITYEGLHVSATAASAPSVLYGSMMTGIGGGWGEYLEFHEVGNWGFMRHIGFPRPAVSKAQEEADKLRPAMEKEALDIAVRLW